MTRPEPRSPLSVGMEWASRVTTIGLEFALPPLLGALPRPAAGDRARWLTLVGAVLGFAVGMMHILRIAREASKPELSRDSSAATASIERPRPRRRAASTRGRRRPSSTTTGIDRNHGRGHGHSPLSHVVDHPTLELPYWRSPYVWEIHLPNLAGFQITRFMVTELIAAVADRG